MPCRALPSSVYLAILSGGLKAGAGLGRGARQVAVSHHGSSWEESSQPHYERLQPPALLGGACVGRSALSVESALIAYSYAATVVGAAVSPYLEQSPMLCGCAVAAYIEVIANCAEAARLVASLQLLYGEVTVAACGRAVYHYIPHALAALHERSRLDVLEQLSLGLYASIGDGQRECFCYHVVHGLVFHVQVSATGMCVE